jgi:hypothetical protein
MLMHKTEGILPSLSRLGGWTDDEMVILHLELHGVHQTVVFQQRLRDADPPGIADAHHVNFLAFQM